MCDLALAIENIDRHENHAELYASQKQLNHFDGVRQMDTQPVSRRESSLGQRVHQPVARGVEVAECAPLQAPIARQKFEGRLIPPLHQRKIKKLS